MTDDPTEVEAKFVLLDTAQQAQIATLKAALRQAILNTSRASKRVLDYDPAGSSYEIDWLPEVVAWAKLADLDLSQRDPFFYTR